MPLLGLPLVVGYLYGIAAGRASEGLRATSKKKKKGTAATREVGKLQWRLGGRMRPVGGRFANPWMSESRLVEVLVA